MLETTSFVNYLLKQQREAIGIFSIRNFMFQKGDVCRDLLIKMPLHGQLVVIRRSGADESIFPLVNEVRTIPIPWWVIVQFLFIIPLSLFCTVVFSNSQILIIIKLPLYNSLRNCCRAQYYCDNWSKGFLNLGYSDFGTVPDGYYAFKSRLRRGISFFITDILKICTTHGFNPSIFRYNEFW